MSWMAYAQQVSPVGGRPTAAADSPQAKNTYGDEKQVIHHGGLHLFQVVHPRLNPGDLKVWVQFQQGS